MTGVVLLILALFLDRGAGWAALIVAGQLVIGLGLAGLLFVVFGYVTGAGWATAIRRVAEAMAGTLPFGAVVVFVALVATLGAYEWFHADHVAEDGLLQHKSAWLNPLGVIVRALVFLALWIVFMRLIRRHSLRQDEPGDASGSPHPVALSCGFLAVFALTYSFASFDWTMSLEPHWFSTVYAIYCFSGLFLAGLAALTLLVVWLRRCGPLMGVLRADHLHDIGKLTFGFATFWAYIWFCQFMLIWYSNIPEETSYYVARMEHPWGPWMLLNLAVNWVGPFLLLLPAAAKRSEATMVRVAVLLLLGRVLDLHLLVAPPLTDSPWSIGWTLGPALAVLCGFLWFFERSLAAAPIVPRRDPYLGESLHYHA